jgi:hypothetical protein
MADKDFIFYKIKAIEDSPRGRLIFKNNNIYFDCLNLTWLGRDILQGYGVPAALASKFNFFYGKIGNDAKNAANKSVSVSEADIQVLFRVSVRISIREVSDHTGKFVFQGLPDQVQAVLVSLWRQFGGLSKAVYPALAMASGMLIRGHIKLAIRYLGDKNGWSAEGDKLMPRRLKEISILETLLKEGK